MYQQHKRNVKKKKKKKIEDKNVLFSLEPLIYLMLWFIPSIHFTLGVFSYGKSCTFQYFKIPSKHIYIMRQVYIYHENIPI